MQDGFAYLFRQSFRIIAWLTNIVVLNLADKTIRLRLRAAAFGDDNVGVRCESVTAGLTEHSDTMSMEESGGPDLLRSVEAKDKELTAMARQHLFDCSRYGFSILAGVNAEELTSHLVHNAYFDDTESRSFIAAAVQKSFQRSEAEENK